MPRQPDDQYPKPIGRPRYEDPPEADDLYDTYCARCKAETEHSLGTCLDCAKPRYRTAVTASMEAK
jgi:hypothetical protein